MTLSVTDLPQEAQAIATEAIKAMQRDMIDRLVRAARTEGWCGEFERSMRSIFPDGHPDSGSTEPTAWLDSDGFTCRGFDREGYSADGFHGETGVDREGFSRNGFNPAGFNRQGFNRRGFNAAGYDADGCDANGYTVDRRDRQGNLEGSDEALAYLHRFDINGYDVDGFDATGHHRETRMNRADHANRFRYDARGNIRRS